MKVIELIIPYVFSHSHATADRTESELVDSMLSRGIIESSDSPWASPVVLVRKKDGKTRFCVDFRKLNDCTRKDAQPLPRIDESLDALGGACFLGWQRCSLRSLRFSLDSEERQRVGKGRTSQQCDPLDCMSD